MEWLCMGWRLRQTSRFLVLALAGLARVSQLGLLNRRRGTKYDMPRIIWNLELVGFDMGCARSAVTLGYQESFSELTTLRHDSFVGRLLQGRAGLVP